MHKYWEGHLTEADIEIEAADEASGNNTSESKKWEREIGIDKKGLDKENAYSSEHRGKICNKTQQENKVGENT